MNDCALLDMSENNYAVLLRIGFVAEGMNMGGINSA